MACLAPIFTKFIMIDRITFRSLIRNFIYALN